MRPRDVGTALACDSGEIQTHALDVQARLIRIRRRMRSQRRLLVTELQSILGNNRHIEIAQAECLDLMSYSI